MELEKMGCLLKELRKENNITQEQMAEIFGVSNRSVSRWENGKTMPDIALLLEISAYFKVDILELINGERKDTRMSQEKDGDIVPVVEYAQEQQGYVMRKMRRKDIIGFVCAIASALFLCLYDEFNMSLFLVLQIVFLVFVIDIFWSNVWEATALCHTIRQKVKNNRTYLYARLLLLAILIPITIYDTYKLFILP